MIFFSNKRVLPKQGGGGVPHLGKIPTFSRFCFFENVPNALCTIFLCNAIFHWVWRKVANRWEVGEDDIMTARLQMSEKTLPIHEKEDTPPLW